MMTTGEYRGADADALRLLVRTLDDAADAVAASSRRVTAVRESLCRDLPVRPLHDVVWSLREWSDDVRRSLAALEGRCVPDRAGAVTFEIPPPAEPESGGWGHTVLDVAGFVPLVGAIPDGVNALWYAAEGDALNAGLSAAALVPFLGDGATGLRFVGRTADEVSAALKSGDEVFTVPDLYANEFRDAAHVIEEHVGKSADDLVARTVRDNLDMASSFHDAQSAARGIDAAFRAHPEALMDVLEGRVRSAVLDVRAPDLGIVVTRAGEVLEANTVWVKVKRADRGGVVVTAYLEAM